ncbi:MAG: amidohydrolase, partial [Ruminococcaceae bacterium]|nr:amidohydrolase [Oscillospiraceae bacterium]
CITKNINYLGVSSHAGGAPHLGVNALYAANLGLQTVNSLRETFKDDDHIRFHPIITQGGGAVNAIPHDIKIESYVRGATIEAIVEANNRINRALAGCAAAMGANVHLSDRPGYMPLNNNKDLTDISMELMKGIIGEENVVYNNRWGTGCTDMGDISSVMPAIHPHVAGASGTGHGNDYRISDPECAVVLSTKYLVALTDALLSNNAEKANMVIKNAKVLYPNKQDYFDQIDKIFMDKMAVEVQEDGKMVLDYKL